MGVTPKPRGNVVYYDEDGITKIYTKEDDTYSWTSLMITNDGASDLTITINNMIITVKADEVFDEDFEDFTEVVVTASVAYRILMRG